MQWAAGVGQAGRGHTGWLGLGRKVLGKGWHEDKFTCVTVGKALLKLRHWNLAAQQVFSIGNHISSVAQAREFGVILHFSLTLCSQSVTKFSCLSHQIISRLKTLFSTLELPLLSKPRPVPYFMVLDSTWAPCSVFDSFNFFSDHHSEWIFSPQHFIMNIFKQQREIFFTVNPYIHSFGSTMIILALLCCLSLLKGLLKCNSDYIVFPPQKPPIASCLLQRKSQTLVITNKGPNDIYHLTFSAFISYCFLLASPLSHIPRSFLSSRADFFVYCKTHQSWNWLFPFPGFLFIQIF